MNMNSPEVRKALRQMNTEQLLVKILFAADMTMTMGAKSPEEDFRDCILNSCRTTITWLIEQGVEIPAEIRDRLSLEARTDA